MIVLFCKAGGIKLSGLGRYRISAFVPGAKKSLDIAPDLTINFGILMTQCCRSMCITKWKNRQYFLVYRFYSYQWKRDLWIWHMLLPQWNCELSFCFALCNAKNTIFCRSCHFYLCIFYNMATSNQSLNSHRHQEYNYWRHWTRVVV